MINKDKIKKLRTIITENLRIQQTNSKSIPFIDTGNYLTDSCARQNHVIFGRRGCGKSLLLHHSKKNISNEVGIVYLNCEDVKRHTFPNVVIYIVDTLFRDMEKLLGGFWGRKRKIRKLLRNMRHTLSELKKQPDNLEQSIKEKESHEFKDGAKLGGKIADLDLGAEFSEKQKFEIERQFKVNSEKLKTIDVLIPDFKDNLRTIFEYSRKIKSIFLQLDDFYHLIRSDQPFVMDYVLRLCKDTPVYFKVATLRHTSTLFIADAKQPIGAQERNDFQAINIDYALTDFANTVEKNRKIFLEFATLAGISRQEFDELFRGEGFSRLILAGAGVPRDSLSFFLEVQQKVHSVSADARIGKDDVRIQSKANFENRINELKQDSQTADQDPLIKAIYIIREFCLGKKTNIFLVSETIFQTEDKLRKLLLHLVDYRIIHNTAVALTHKSQGGSFQAFAIDIGCYAYMRTLSGKMNEIDISAHDAKERMRSSPILSASEFSTLWQKAPNEISLSNFEDA